ADFLFLGTGPWRKGFTALDFVTHLGLDRSDFLAKHRSIVAMCGYLGLSRDGQQIPLEELEKIMPRSLTFEEMQTLAASGGCRAVLLAATRNKLDPVICVIKARLCNALFLDHE